MMRQPRDPQKDRLVNERYTPRVKLLKCSPNRTKKFDLDNKFYSLRVHGIALTCNIEYYLTKSITVTCHTLRPSSVQILAVLTTGVDCHLTLDRFGNFVFCPDINRKNRIFHGLFIQVDLCVLRSDWYDSSVSWILRLLRDHG